MKLSSKAAPSPATKSPSSTSNEDSIVQMLRVAQRAFEASQRQPKMTAQEMREQVRRNEIEWERNRYK